MQLRHHYIPSELARRFDAVPWATDLDTDGRSIPDFAVLFPVPDHSGVVPRTRDKWTPAYGCVLWDSGTCPRCSLLVTPRLAYMLHSGAALAWNVFCDGFSEAVHGDLTHTVLHSSLPGPVLRYLDRLPEEDAAVWLGQFATTIKVVAARLAVGEVPVPRSTAEEMALHLAIDAAGVWAGTPEGFDLNFDALPEVDERDDDLDRVSDLFFEDDDVLWLFDPSLDGVGDVGSEATSRVRTANLHGRDWFRSFRETDPVSELHPIPDVDG